MLDDPRLAYRLGQRSFMAVVLDAYRRRCAISGTHIPPVLQAAHIRAVAAVGWLNGFTKLQKLNCQDFDDVRVARRVAVTGRAGGATAGL